MMRHTCTKARETSWSKDKTINNATLKGVLGVGTLREYKIARINMLKALLGKLDNMHEQMDNFSQEKNQMDT
jgi:hypothetical protein